MTDYNITILPCRELGGIKVTVGKEDMCNNICFKSVADLDHFIYQLKQGEQKPAEWHREDEQNLNACLGYIPDEFLRRWLIDVIHVKYDKPTNKVEPKFKVGEWIIENGANRNPVQIKSFEEDNGVGIRVWFSNGTGTYIDFLKGYHKWTIKDAKDGDVLVNMFDDFIFIYNSTSIPQAYYYYCSGRNRFIIEDRGHYCHWNMQEVKPATKEQRDLLFHKMKEAGYMWDAEKKEPKKIKKNVYEPDTLIEESYQQQADDLIDMVTEKPSWSEEDEEILRTIISDGIRGAEFDMLQIDWLKSLKDKYAWKPSDEQLDALQYVYRNSNPLPSDKLGWNSLKTLELMYHDLKKLKGE